jgi:hypothetical protein
MKKWNTIQQLGLELAELDKLSLKQKNDLGLKELNITQCTHAAKTIVELYKEGGSDNVLDLLFSTLDSRSPISNANYHGFTIEEKTRIEQIVKTLFKHSAIPFSRINRNMKRLSKKRLVDKIKSLF